MQNISLTWQIGKQSQFIFSTKYVFIRCIPKLYSKLRNQWTSQWRYIKCSLMQWSVPSTVDWKLSYLFCPQLFRSTRNNNKKSWSYLGRHHVTFSLHCDALIALSSQKNCPFHWGSWAHLTHHSKLHLHQVSHFYKIYICYQQTDIQIPTDRRTERTRNSVCTNSRFAS